MADVLGLLYSPLVVIRRIVVGQEYRSNVRRCIEAFTTMSPYLFMEPGCQNLASQLSSNEGSFRHERLYVNKLNIILVQVLESVIISPYFSSCDLNGIQDAFVICTVSSFPFDVIEAATTARPVLTIAMIFQFGPGS